MRRSILTFLILQSIDIATTWFGIHTGIAREANSVFHWAIRTFGVFSGLILVKTLILIPAFFCLYRTPLKIQVNTTRAANYLYSALAVWNCSQLAYGMWIR